LDQFALRLLLSFVVGGSWVTIITEATLRYGQRLGGLLAGFPSTAAFSLAFIGWTQSTAAAVEATTALPLALSFTATFPLVYATLAGGGSFRKAILGALSIWLGSSFILSAVAVSVGIGFVISVAGFYVVSACAYLLLARNHGQRAPARGINLSSFQWVWRFVLAGGIVVGAVLLSATLGPLVGGVFASFPAIITSTIYIITRVDGVEASRGIATPVMVATVFTIVPYTIVVRYSYPAFGVLLGTAAGYAAAVPLSLVAYLVIGRAAARAEEVEVISNP
jgi:hypothetical protein